MYLDMFNFNTTRELCIVIKVCTEQSVRKIQFRFVLEVGSVKSRAAGQTGYKWVSNIRDLLQCSPNEARW